LTTTHRIRGVLHISRLGRIANIGCLCGREGMSLVHCKPTAQMLSCRTSGATKQTMQLHRLECRSVSTPMQTMHHATCARVHVSWFCQSTTPGRVVGLTTRYQPAAYARRAVGPLCCNTHTHGGWHVFAKDAHLRCVQGLLELDLLLLHFCRCFCCERPQEIGNADFLLQHSRAIETWALRTGRPVHSCAACACCEAAASIAICTTANKWCKELLQLYVLRLTWWTMSSSTRLCTTSLMLCKVTPRAAAFFSISFSWYTSSDS
jgi:hypothetical protein